MSLVPTGAYAAASINSTADAYERKEIQDAMGVIRPCLYSKEKILSLNMRFFYEFVEDATVGTRLGSNERVDLIIRMIKSISPDIIVLQEGRDSALDSPFTNTVEKIAKALKMSSIIHGNQGSLYNPNKYFHYDSTRFYPPSTEEGRSNWDDEVRNGCSRQITINIFYPKFFKEIKPGQTVEAPDYAARPWKILNQNLGMGKKERDLDRIAIQKEMETDSYSHILSFGDHNSLPISGSSIDEEQMNWSHHGWKSLTTHSYLSQHRAEVTGSFAEYPSAGIQLDINYKKPLDGHPDYVTPDERKWKEKLEFRTFNVIGKFDETDDDLSLQKDYLLEPVREYSNQMAMLTKITRQWSQINKP